MIVDVVFAMKSFANNSNLDIKIVLNWIEMLIFVFNHFISPIPCDIKVVEGFSFSGTPLNVLVPMARPRKRENFKLGVLREKPQPLG